MNTASWAGGDRLKGVAMFTFCSKQDLSLSSLVDLHVLGCLEWESRSKTRMPWGKQLTESEELMLQDYTQDSGSSGLHPGLEFHSFLYTGGE
ncbi:uncharacterized protein LOC143514590 [Brachyhypopomus gauderio]|uniref:uncharacterized protein LOC143514590 n=1 Tax=Brachyhypopomus gauderio TaxID=698409 RepID=UPI0040434E98